MRWNMTERKLKRSDRLAVASAWHKWFAWHPVDVGDEDVVWFEYVYRRKEVRDWRADWEYITFEKLLESSPDKLRGYTENDAQGQTQTVLTAPLTSFSPVSPTGSFPGQVRHTSLGTEIYNGIDWIPLV